ncbi:MAG: hypothetical protein J0H67_16080 [Rhodospirillales bacterium]|nr:hypothetical protein [Rhodospirillales bacterium]
MTGFGGTATPWLLAVVALVPLLAVPAWHACRGDSAQRLVALQLGGALTVPILMLMSFAFDQSSFGDLPLVLALLTLPGTLLLALFLERWL